MINLAKFLIACDVPLNTQDYKIHLATMGTTSPLEAYYEGKFKKWQENQSRKNFNCDMVIGLIQVKKNKWLFSGVYKILGYKEMEGRVFYSTKLVDSQEDLIGRIIIDHERKGRQAYIWGKSDVEKNFVVSEIREKKLSVQDFPGYNSVLITHRILKSIVEQRVDSWFGALSNIKGVYLIMDSSTGNPYVGSAVGESGIWERWSSYSQNGHGGNRELRLLLKEKGQDYRLNFQYSILEIADSHASDDYVLQRESYWKDVLMSRQFGLNGN